MYDTFVEVEQMYLETLPVLFSYSVSFFFGTVQFIAAQTQGTIISPDPSLHQYKTSTHRVFRQTETLQKHCLPITPPS